MLSKDHQKRKIRIIILSVILILITAVSVFFIALRTRNTDAHVFYFSYSIVYLSAVRSQANECFDNLGIKYQNYDGSNNQATQLEQILSTLSRKPGVIAVNLLDGTAVNTAEKVTKAASEADIPVIFFNTEVPDEVINSYDQAYFIGTKIEEAGIIQGKMVGEYLLEHYKEADLNHDGKIQYIMFKGKENNPEANARTQYSVETANEILTKAGYPELEFYDPNNSNRYLADKGGGWSAVAANEYLASALIKYNDSNNNMIELVIANNDSMAEGAVSALQKVGYNTGSGDKYIPVYGVDAVQSAITLIDSGCMTGTVRQDAAKMGETISIMCDNYLKNRYPLSGLEDIPIDEDCRKLRIHYTEYTGN